MTANYVLLERIQVGEAGASSVIFQNIPQSGYTDLKIVISARNNNSATDDAINIAFNTDSFTTNASIKLLRGTGSGVVAASGSYLITGYMNAASSTANAFCNHEVYISNYLSSNYKSISTDSVYENNATGAIIQLNALLWSNNAAISKISLAPNTGNPFAQYSTFSLYGLAAVGTTPVIAPYASGGDIIETDGTYWYHAFLSSGTFTPAKGLSCDILQVAGGGGTSQDSGGGGAGGLLVFNSQALAANTAQTVIIGAGGNQSTGTNDDSTSGSNTTFGSLTASIGGGRARYQLQNPTGGSGAGGNGNGGTTTPGSGTSGQGYAGGNGAGTCSGGGGGAGGAGGNANGATIGGTGGIGATSALINAMGAATNTGQLSGGNYYFAGGGAGWYGAPAAGLGGGGAQSSNATPNTGGGAGAYRGKGGSGIVIVRYAI